MSLFDTKDFFEKIGIKPSPIEYTSPITGQPIKRSAPTMLKDSVRIIQNTIKQYHEAHPVKTSTSIDYDYDYEDIGDIKERELTYSANEEECKKQIETLLSFIETMTEQYRPKTLYIERQDTTISYGEITANGTKVEHGLFGMSNDNVLRVIYELIRIRYASTFNENISYSLNGWTLSPMISEETDVSFISNRNSDIEWILNEKEIIQDRKRSKKGLY